MRVALVLLVGLVWGGAGCARRASIEAGRQLFAGERPISARQSGEDTDLPSEASRCVNCHLFEPASDAGLVQTQTFGPPLTGKLLMARRGRRGGPPSSYDPDTFCTLLRTGVDPSHIVVQRAMPRYDLNVADCRALWDYLMVAP